MKQFIFLFILLGFQFLKAQSPQGINYQAIARNASGALVANAPVGVRISILDQSPTGTVLYAETHQPTTNANGSFALVIGQGTVVSGTFTAIPWGNQAKFLQVEYDPTGGTSYSVSGTQQLMSVPYALYAHNAGRPDDSLRAVNAISVQEGGLHFGEASGPVNAYTMSITPEFPQLVKGMKFVFQANLANTGAATLQINGFAPKAILKNVTQNLSAGDILAGQIIEVYYDGTVFQCVGMTSSKSIKADSYCFVCDGF